MTDLLVQMFLGYFPHGGVIAHLIATIIHLVGGAMMMYGILYLTSLLLRSLLPKGTIQNARKVNGGNLSALAVFQGLNALGTSLLVGYLLTKYTHLSPHMWAGYAYVMFVTIMFIGAVRIFLTSRLKLMILGNHVVSGVVLGLLYVACSVLALGAFMYRY